MTKAAQDLHLTQSGVSQHIKSLEETLGVKLFDRVNRRLLPTREGENLFRSTQPALSAIEEALLLVTKKAGAIEGEIRIGMPIEFGNNFLIPALSEIAQRFSGLQFSIKMDFASAMNEALLNGSLDFAFVDDYPMDSNIAVEPVGSETLELCASLKYLKTKGAPKHDWDYYEKLDFVDYQKNEPILRKWLSHHVAKRPHNLRMKAWVMDVQGIARFVLTGMGAGVLPDHLVRRLLGEGRDLYVFEGSGKPLKNGISLAILKDRVPRPAVKSVMEMLKQSLRAPHS